MRDKPVWLRKVVAFVATFVVLVTIEVFGADYFPQWFFAFFSWLGAFGLVFIIMSIENWKSN